MNMCPFGQALYLWRRHRGLTQESLARRARIPRPNLSAVERGKREVSLGTLRALALALGIRPGVLADGTAPAELESRPISLSRETMERIANAVAFGRPAANAREQEIVAALRLLLRPRTAAIQGGRSPGRVSRRAAMRAWMTVTGRYSHSVVQHLADRVAERQRTHESSLD